MKIKILISVTLTLCFFSLHVKAGENNCILSQQSNWINHEGTNFPHDIFMMHDSAQSKQSCEDLCSQYSAENIEPNTDSFDSIGYKCFYNGDMIDEKQLK